jgi:hypothetical protein
VVPVKLSAANDGRFPSAELEKNLYRIFGMSAKAPPRGFGFVGLDLP